MNGIYLDLLHDIREFIMVYDCWNINLLSEHSNMSFTHVVETLNIITNHRKIGISTLWKSECLRRKIYFGGEPIIILRGLDLPASARKSSSCSCSDWRCNCWYLLPAGVLNNDGMKKYLHWIIRIFIRINNELASSIVLNEGYFDFQVSTSNNTIFDADVSKQNRIFKIY